jgi:hypothetical protein
VARQTGGQAWPSLSYATVLAIKAPRAGGDARARRSRVASLDRCAPVGRRAVGQSRPAPADTGAGRSSPKDRSAR